MCAGNHAFATEYAELVPDTWHVINDQDIVVHGMKLFGWYKRNGNRVILNGRGDLIVRPSHLELSLFQARPQLTICQSCSGHTVESRRSRVAHASCTRYC
jgi:hypothetical protein